MTDQTSPTSILPTPEQPIVIHPMKNIHETTIHARCPYAPVWDYYTLTVTTPEFMRCEHLQEICDGVRGQEMTQEDVFQHIRKAIKPPAQLTLEGCHGQNGRLRISG